MKTPGLFDAIQDLLVLDLQFGIVLGLFADSLSVGVVLPGVGGTSARMAILWMSG